MGSWISKNEDTGRHRSNAVGARHSVWAGDPLTSGRGKHGDGSSGDDGGSGKGDADPTDAAEGPGSSTEVSAAGEHQQGARRGTSGVGKKE
jgi:hypothetical protein